MSTTDTLARCAREVRSVLESVAPEADLDSMREDVDLRDELDIDSMDFLNVLVGIQQRVGVEVPEADYAKVRTFADLVAYVQSRIDGAENRGP
jgi:acyl carrier protein